MKKEYVKWNNFLIDIENTLKKNLKDKERAFLISVLTFAKEKGYTSKKQDMITIQIISRYK